MADKPTKPRPPRPRRYVVTQPDGAKHELTLETTPAEAKALADGRIVLRNLSGWVDPASGSIAVTKVDFTSSAALDQPQEQRARIQAQQSLEIAEQDRLSIEQDRLRQAAGELADVAAKAHERARRGPRARVEKLNKGGQREIALECIRQARSERKAAGKSLDKDHVRAAAVVIARKRQELNPVLSAEKQERAERLSAASGGKLSVRDVLIDELITLGLVREAASKRTAGA